MTPIDVAKSVLTSHGCSWLIDEVTWYADPPLPRYEVDRSPWGGPTLTMRALGGYVNVILEGGQGEIELNQQEAVDLASFLIKHVIRFGGGL